MKEDNTKDIFGPVMRFFLFCSAADKDLLAKCPNSERHKYAGVGATVLFTGLLAVASGGYALYTAFNALWLSILLGLFWGLLVFNLDRFLVSTMKKSKGKLKELIQIFPRLLLAVLLSFVISVPLELKIFEEEINESLFYAGAKKLDDMENSFNKRLEQKQARIETLRINTEKKLEVRDVYYKDYVCECDGTCGTGQKGRGSECERKELKYRQTNEEYLLFKRENDAEILLIRADKDQLQEQFTKDKTSLQASFSDGLLVRIDALRVLPPGPQLAIILLLISIEIAPILMKLLSPYGPYDHLLKTIEYEFEINEITSINMRNQELNNRLTVLASVEQRKIDLELKNNEGALKLIGEAHLELVKEQLKIWVAKEKSRIQNELGV